MIRNGTILLFILALLLPTGCSDDSEQIVTPNPPPKSKKLLISEVVVQPAEAEFVEIYNPTPNTISLSRYYLADYSTYYQITTAGGPPGATDLRVRFPDGATIPPGGVVTVAIGSSADFTTSYGSAPDFDLDPIDAGAPAMTGEATVNSGLSNGEEMLVLFYWDGASPLVSDVDYLVWGGTTFAADKTGIVVATESYLPDTAPGSQDPSAPPGAGQAVARTATAEGAQKATGGNGVTGSDETSEDFSNTWPLTLVPTPGSVPFTP
jgi:hypothetical protein